MFTKIPPTTEVLTNELSLPVPSVPTPPSLVLEFCPESTFPLTLDSPPESPQPPSLPTHSSQGRDPKILPVSVASFQPIQPLRCSTRQRTQSVCLDGYHIFVTRDDPDLCFLTIVSPTLAKSYDDITITFDQAMHNSSWLQSMHDKLSSIYANHTWTLQELPPRVKPINSQWIFKLKLGLGDSPPVKKARLVAMGNQQKDGLDYLETFALVIK